MERSTDADLLFVDVRIATPIGPVRGWLATAGSRIAALGPGAPPAALAARARIAGDGGLLMPGFVDVHIHGALGHEAIDADADGLRALARFLARHGVTAFLATTGAASPERIAAALATVAEVARERREPAAARLLGAHMEGPYLNPARAGGQDASQIRPPARAEVDACLRSGVVRLMTIAPELPQGPWLIDALRAHGVTVSAGHTDATYAQMRDAVGRGVRHVTHTFNAMRPLHHREPGVVGAALLSDELRCELIADGHHVDPAAMRLLLRARGPEGVVLVSDAVGPTGLGDGTYRLDGRSVRVAEGTVRFADGGFAGSVLTLDRAVANVVAATGLDAAALWPASSGNAAAAAGAPRTGRIAVGLDADLVLLDGDLRVRTTVVEGAVAYARDGGEAT
jgi:N-acetylglucosamine-6-phosphate deacetylase